MLPPYNPCMAEAVYDIRVIDRFREGQLPLIVPRWPYTGFHDKEVGA